MNTDIKNLVHYYLEYRGQRQYLGCGELVKSDENSQFESFLVTQTSSIFLALLQFTSQHDEFIELYSSLLKEESRNERCKFFGIYRVINQLVKSKVKIFSEFRNRKSYLDYEVLR